MPRAFKAAAISLSVVAPAFCASRIMGRTFAANLLALEITASTALLRATWSFGLPKVTPRAFAADRACRVRVEISARSFSANAAHERVNVGAKLSDHEGHLVSDSEPFGLSEVRECLPLGLYAQP